MGCTASKEDRKGEFDQVQQQVPDQRSPERNNVDRPPAPPPEPTKEDTTTSAPAETSAPAPPSDVDVTSADGQNYLHGGPSVAGGVVVPCFNQGFLFRITTVEAIYFYNDSADHEMHIEYAYKLAEEAKSEGAVRPAPNVSVNREDPDMPVLNLVVYPGNTEKLIDGTFGGYRAHYQAKSLSKEYQRLVEQQAAAISGAQMDKLRGAIPDAAGMASGALLERCARDGHPFVDVAFPPEHRSLSGDHDSRELTALLWRRPHPASSVDACAAGPNSLVAGQLGDCWVACALAVLAEDAHRFEGILATTAAASDAERSEREVGGYRVTLNKHGRWTTLVVDDFLPCIGRVPYFTRAEFGAAIAGGAASSDTIARPFDLTSALVQKAYAKANGTYATISSGDTLHALADFTGAPCSRFDAEWRADDKKGDKAALFARLAALHREGHLVVVSTPGADDSSQHSGAASTAMAQRCTSVGLPLGHTLAVTAVAEAGSTRMLQIRQPWRGAAKHQQAAAAEWRWGGEWAEGSAKWTEHPDVEAACSKAASRNPEPASSSGTSLVWLSWEEAQRYFDGGGVCYRLPGDAAAHHDYRVPGTFTDGCSDVVLEITAHADVTLYLTLSQPDRRGQPVGSAAAKQSPLMLSVFKGQDPSKGTAPRMTIDANTTADTHAPDPQFSYLISRDVSMRYTFAKSAHSYLVVPRIHDNAARKDFTLGLLAACSLASKEIEVRFRKVATDSSAFKHCRAFTMPASEALEREYQVRVGAQLVQSRTSSAISA